jgi:hypothetical protein
MLFKGSGHTFSEIAALADASKPLSRFALAFRLKADVAATRAAEFSQYRGQAGRQRSN